MSDVLQTPFGQFTLRRYPNRRKEQLQAWNNADELLLEMAAGSGVAPDRVLVVNDEHGAVSIPLGPCTVWSDSALTEQAIVENAALNGLDRSPGVLMMDDAVPAQIDLVLMRIPKHLDLLRLQLQQLRRALPATTPLIATAMQKHLAPGREKIFEAHYGPTERHPGWHRARAFSSTLDPTLEDNLAGLSHWYCEELDQEIGAWPGVFSAGELDQGTRFMLQNLPQLGPARLAVDLACGSGVLGLYLARNCSCRSLVFVDESALAVASARHNSLQLADEIQAVCQFVQADGFEDWTDRSPDLVLCNPPFHLQHTVDDFAGRRLIEQTARILDIDGELWLVANRHLLYGRTLRRYYRDVRQYAQDKKFILWHARN